MPTAAETETACRAAMAADDWPLAEALGLELDGPPRTFGLLGAALFYAELGLRVFPLKPRSKVPFSGSRGCRDATSSAAVIGQWWAWHPDSNIGIATGHGVDVIDVDGPDSPSGDGIRSWSQLIGGGDLPPVLGVVSTPRAGGSHLYVVATGEGNRAAMVPGLDYRGLGGYVVAPPSVSADGVAYRWRRPLDLSAGSHD